MLGTRRRRAPARAVRVLLLGCLLGALPARAHAPPEVLRIEWKSQEELVLVTNRGLIFGQRAGGSFRLMCGEALDVNSGEQPSVAHRRDGGLLAATSSGLFLTHDQGCSWAPVPPLVDMFVPALARHPGDPDTLIAASFGGGQSALRITHDGGEHWAVLSALQDRDYTRALLFAPSDPSRLYASGTELISTPAPLQRHYAARSTDAGEHWERWELTLGEDELDLRLLAVNPTRPDELVARVTSASPGFIAERLVLSDDGGETFTSPLALLAIGGAAFSADGETVWVAAREGLYRAGPERSFQRVGDAERVTCVGQGADGALWACGRYAGLGSLHDGVGSSPDASGAFVPFMDYPDVSSAVACPAESQTAVVCEPWWNDFWSEVSGANLDAGAEPPDAEAAQDASAPQDGETAALDATSPAEDSAASLSGDASVQADAGSAPADGCGGCALGGGERAAPFWLLGLLVFARSRRRARS